MCSSDLDLDAVFGRRAPRIVEIGFGNGENLLTLAERHPDRDVLGIEVHGAGVGRVLGAMRDRDVRNIRIVRHDAVEVFEHGLAPGTIDEILIFFPDPWPKARHAKRRFLRPTTAALLADRLAPQGFLHLATDWPPYVEHTREVLGAWDVEQVQRPAHRPVTGYERRGRRAGRESVDLLARPPA